jgi:PKD repeat protein
LPGDGRSLVELQLSVRLVRASPRRSIVVGALSGVFGLGLGPALAVAPRSAAASEPALYVDRSNPACSDAGPGSQSQPYCSIQAGANHATAGMTVQVAAGTYNEEVSPAASGTAGGPITFVAAPGNTVTITSRLHGFNIISRNFITVRGFTLADQSDTGVYISSGNNVVVSGLSVTGTVSDGIRAVGADKLTLTDNTVTFTGKPGSGLYGKGIRLNSVTGSLVRGNHVLHDSDSGIYVDAYSSGNTLDANESAYNARGLQSPRIATGIDVRGSNNTVTRNNTHENEDSGIQFYGPASNNLVVGNVTWGNCDHGIDDYNATGQRIIGNSTYQNFAAGINLEGDTSSASSGGTLVNNVGSSDAVSGTFTDRCPTVQNPSWRTRGNFRVDTRSIPGTRVDYDVSFQASPSDTLYTWGTTRYSTLSSFQAASGQEAHGSAANPNFAAPSSGDLHPTAGSSVIDAADSSAPGWPALDTDGQARVDDPATANSGIGPRSFDDRGAYEFVDVAPPPVDQAPVARLTVTPTSGTAPLAVTADGSASTDGEATPIASYRFDFGDGTVVGPQPGSTADHIYATAGSFTATVMVVDTADLASTASEVVNVAPPPVDQAPVARLTVTPTSGTAPLAVTADGSASTDGDATPIASYRFDFGDGTVVGPQPGSTADHTYATAGSFTATVMVVDTADLASTASEVVNVGSGTVNLIGNSGFEVDTTGWGGASGATIARTAGGHSGGFSVLVSNPGSSAISCTMNDSPNWVTTTSAGTYTMSAWVRADTGGAHLKLKLREYVGTTLIGSAQAKLSLTTGWQQVTVSYAVTSPGSSTLDLQADVARAPSGPCFYADDLVLTRA